LQKGKINEKLVSILLSMLIFYLGITTFEYWGGILARVFRILLPFILAFAISYVLYPFTKSLEKWGLPKTLAKVLVLFFLSFFIIWLLSLTIPLIYEQLISFTSFLSEAINQLSVKFHLELGTLEESILSGLEQVIARFGEYISSGTLAVLDKSVHFFGDFMVIVAASIYFFLDMDKIRHYVKQYLQTKTSNLKWYEYLRELDHEMGNYLHGLSLCMMVQLVEYSLLFYLVGHPNWLLLGVLASVTTVIPYFGGILTNVIAIITASAVSPIVCLKTVFVVIIFSNVDSYLISPHIYGKTNNINPLLTILAIAFCSNFFGVLGIIMALPIYLTIRCTWRFFNKEIKEKWYEVKR